MNNIIIRKGKIEDAQDFSHLVLLSASTFFPSLFGSNAAKVMKNLFQQSGNFFSFEHSYFIEVNNKRAGMALGYNWEQKRQEELYTGLLLVKYLRWSFFTQLPYLLKAQNIVGKFAESEYYLSNIAIYPEFRGLGLGTKLLGTIEEEARKTGCKRMVLDVETDNKRAIKLYEKIEYSIEQKSPIFKIRDKNFEFFKMSKDIEKKGNIKARKV